MSLRLHRNWIILAIALLVGAAAAMTATRYLDDRVADIERRVEQKTARAVVAKESLSAGERIDHERVAVREVPVEWLHSGAISPEQFDRAAGSALAFPAQRGEPLMWSQLEGRSAPALSARLAPGRRAVTLSVDEVSSIAGMLEPGDKVDLLLTVRRDRDNLTLPLIQGVSVLAAGARTVVAGAPEGGERRYTTITLDASAEEGQRIIAARTVGTITAMLRGPGDHGVLATVRPDALALLGLEQRPADSRPSVPVIYGGRGGQLVLAQPLDGLVPYEAQGGRPSPPLPNSGRLTPSGP